MSMHKTPLTDLERRGLHAHCLSADEPSQLSDAFRAGVAWAGKDIETFKSELEAKVRQNVQLMRERDEYRSHLAMIAEMTGNEGDIGAAWEAVNALQEALAASEKREQALAAQVEWHPIDEAEKYNGEYLLYAPDLVDLDFNPMGVVEGHWQDDQGWVGAAWCGCHDCWNLRVIEPTHFLRKFNPGTVPTTSLASLIAEKQAEALEQFATDWPWDELRPDHKNIRHYAQMLRRQAEQAATAREGE